MGLRKLAILGAGSVRCTPPVVAALATYFGERPLEVRLYDSDAERLDLFSRFAQTCFLLMKATHELTSHLDPAEALEGVDRVVLQVGTNCAKKYLRARGKLDLLPSENHNEPQGSLQKDGYRPQAHDSAVIQSALDLILEYVPNDADVLSLQDPEIVLPGAFRHADWPVDLSLDERVALPHQVLRWIHGEEYPHDLIGLSERSPLKAWLDDVEALKA